MCMACEMEAMWFAAMEARARAAAVPQANLLPEGVEKGGAGHMRGEKASPLPHDNSRGELDGPPAEEGGTGTAPPRFVCEETQGE